MVSSQNLKISLAPTGRGRPGGEPIGNNLSFPAIFPGASPTLRVYDASDPTKFLFSSPYAAPVNGFYQFAQGVAGNIWQAGNIANAGTIVVDYLDIGDAFETAPLRTGANVRLELSLYQDLISLDMGESHASGPLTAFSMDLLGGAKGGGKPTVKGPTELQGTKLAQELWTGIPYVGDTDSPLTGTTYLSNYATIYGANPSIIEGDTVDSHMSLAIQKVSNLAANSVIPVDELTGLPTALAWSGTQWADVNTSDDITIGGNLASNLAFGPELNIAGKYIMGASGKPWKFTEPGNYLVTFAVEEGAPFSFDETTQRGNYSLGAFDVAGGRNIVLVPDGNLSSIGDTHNGLAYAIIGVPSSVTETSLI